MALDVYLSGEIHTDWRQQIVDGSEGLDVSFWSPVTDHASSDDVGPIILGAEGEKFWHDQKSAQINAMRIDRGIAEADIVVVRFGEQYKQWNAAFDAGKAVALGKSLIVISRPEDAHPLKEIHAAARAVCETPAQVCEILRYILTGRLPAGEPSAD